MQLDPPVLNTAPPPGFVALGNGSRLKREDKIKTEILQLYESGRLNPKQKKAVETNLQREGHSNRSLLQRILGVDPSRTWGEYLGGVSFKRERPMSWSQLAEQFGIKIDL